MMVVYKITNKFNNKVYIGITTRDFKERMKTHKNNKSNTKFYNAIKKYGWESFTKEIIEEVDDLEKLFKREIYWISFYNSYKKGYNSTIGGDVSPMLFEENKNKLSKTLKNKLQTQEQKNKQIEKLLEYCKTHKHPRLNCKLTDETKKRISESHKGKKLSEKHIVSVRLGSKKRKPIYQYDLNNNLIKKYDSIRQASAETKITRGALRNSANKNISYKNIYFWKYVKI